MNHSDQINELAAALAKAQAELRNPVFDSQNPHFKSKFASLAQVRETLLVCHATGDERRTGTAERGNRTAPFVRPVDR